MKIICEIGSNWRTFEDCTMSIDKAKECGADIVKFQAFSPEELYGPNAGFMIDLMAYSMPKWWVPSLASYADKVGIEFMCTAFSVMGYKEIDPYVKRHKVASSEMVDFRLLDYLNTTGKHVLLSTAGASIAGEIMPALEHLKDLWLHPTENLVTLMHCVGDYPACTHDEDKMTSLMSIHSTSFGYSDHTIEIEPWSYPGIDWYEKHVSFINGDTPDSGHSLNEAQFKHFVARARGRNSTYVCNQDMNKLYRRRVVATKDIIPGEKLELGLNIGIYRPMHPSTDHVPPLLQELYQGTKAKNFIEAGSTVKMSDL